VFITSGIIRTENLFDYYLGLNVLENGNENFKIRTNFEIA
jgi:hypothetical protein